MQVTTGGSRVSPAVKALLTLLASLLVISGFSTGTWSAFSTVKANSGNSFAAGTVLLSDNDSGNALMSLNNAKALDSTSACIVVTYTGTLPATVRLYGSTTGTGLAQYLNLTVTRGTIASPTFPSCTGFTADTSNYVGAGAGVIYNGTLQSYPATYAAGLSDPASGSPHTWTNPESHVYMFAVSVQDNNAAQGLTATPTFTWEARNT
jgi:hypothetical protein